MVFVYFETYLSMKSSQSVFFMIQDDSLKIIQNESGVSGAMDNMSDYGSEDCKSYSE